MRGRPRKTERLVRLAVHVPPEHAAVLEFLAAKRGKPPGKVAAEMLADWIAARDALSR